MTRSTARHGSMLGRHVPMGCLPLLPLPIHAAPRRAAEGALATPPCQPLSLPAHDPPGALTQFPCCSVKPPPVSLFPQVLLKLCEPFIDPLSGKAWGKLDVR